MDKAADRRMVLAFRTLYLSNGTGFFALCFSFVFVHECASCGFAVLSGATLLNTPISGSCISGAGFKCNCKQTQRASVFGGRTIYI
ncbi:MAG: hypothetical protein LUC21_00985, partial [Oscillospiraceae bacterium]|nr:hypothetical protein [Oscillospiraceae bacterium]